MAKIRPLSVELAKKAQEELNEVPERIQDDLSALRDWITLQPHLKPRTDNQFLVTFLRGCKYSLERTKEKLDSFYAVRTAAPEMFTKRDPKHPVVIEVISLGILLPLPDLPSSDGTRLFLFRPFQYDPKKITMEDMMTVFFLMYDVMFIEDDNIAVAGQKIIFDLSDMSMGHLVAMTPTLVKKCILMMQDVSPLRLKALHYINMSPAFEAVFSIVKRCLNEKNRNRINIHSDLDDLYKAIPKKLLPTEYGGEAGTIKKISDSWEKKLISHRDYLMDEKNYGTNEKLRPGKARDAENLFGIEGSIRKLNVD